MGVNDAAWEELFKRFGMAEALERDGLYRISADEIRKLREPRLMTKFDHAVNLPRIFADKGLAILPVSRGEYVISSFRAYEKIPRDSMCGSACVVRPPAHLQSLSSRYVTSEAVALHYAGACGIWKDFLADEDMTPTISGRMGSGEFKCLVSTARGNLSLVVRNAQLEIDAACEGRGSLALIEAKMDLSEDFHIRQLYYPFRLWRERVSKPVRNVFFNYSDGTFLVYEYVFDDPMCYNSLRLHQMKRYVVATDITMRDLETLSAAVACGPEPNEPFPQADNFARVVNLLELLHEHPMTPEEISSAYSFTPRQAGYYSAAGRYLGLAEHLREQGCARHALSERGRRIMGLPLRERKLALAAEILKHAVFRETLCAAFASGPTAELPQRGEIVDIMRHAAPCGVEGESTFIRRASTVRGWIRWILELAGESGDPRQQLEL